MAPGATKCVKPFFSRQDSAAASTVEWPRKCANTSRVMSTSTSEGPTRDQRARRWQGVAAASVEVLQGSVLCNGARQVHHAAGARSF